MRILFNPENGAPIKNFHFEDILYMVETDGDAFFPGMIVKVDDDQLVDYILKTWEFVQELTPEQAKDFLETKEEFKCDKCDFKTKVRIGFEGHKRKHVKESQIDALGIKSVAVKKKVVVTDDNRVEKWEEEDKKAGLEGQGLTEDSPKKSTVMS